MENLALVGLGIFFLWLIVHQENMKKTKLPKYDGSTPICPRCGKSRYHTVSSTEVVIPGKTKTQSSINLNPLKPFTLVNHKEKVVRQEISRQVVKFMCDECGNIWG